MKIEIKEKKAREMELMEFIEKEEKRLNDCLQMHENSAKLLKEDIDAIKKIRKLLLGQSGCETAHGGS